MRFWFWILLFVFVTIRVISTKPSFVDGQRVRITSAVTSEPILYENALGIKILGLRAYVPIYPSISYGDTIAIEGVVEEGRLISPKVIEIKKTQNLLFKFRLRLVDYYDKSIHQPHSGLLSGIVLGSKKGLSNEFWEKLKVTGTAHVVVASGMNVTFLAGFVMAILLQFISRPKAACLAILAIWIYSFLSGFDAPIVRASIMGSITFTALILGRVNVALRALLLSAALMLLFNPLWIEDLGFILSFAATGSLILFESRVASKLLFVPKLFRDGLSTSLSAQIGVAPILLLAFSQVNLLSPLINAIILWTIPIIMIIGSLSALVSFISEPLGRGLLYLAYPFTLFFVTVVNSFS